VSCMDMPCMLYGPATCSVRTCTDRYGQHQIFACLARRTDRDISSIRTLFAKVNIPSESGRRDERNGTIFISILSTLKIEQIFAPWSRF
jgi:hypothetical protein